MLGPVLRSTTSLKSRFWVDLWSTANEPPYLSSSRKKGMEFISSCQAVVPIKKLNTTIISLSAKNSVIAVWLNKFGMSWESGASPCLTGTCLLIVFVTSQGEILSPRALGQEAPDVCRSGTPGDSPADYLEGVGKASSDCTAAPRAVLGSTTCSLYGLRHVTSSLFLFPLWPP